MPHLCVDLLVGQLCLHFISLIVFFDFFLLFCRVHGSDFYWTEASYLYSKFSDQMTQVANGIRYIGTSENMHVNIAINIILYISILHCISCILHVESWLFLHSIIFIYYLFTFIFLGWKYYRLLFKINSLIIFFVFLIHGKQFYVIVFVCKNVWPFGDDSVFGTSQNMLTQYFIHNKSVACYHCDITSNCGYLFIWYTLKHTFAQL